MPVPSYRHATHPLDVGPSAGVYEATELGRAVAGAIMAAFSRAVGREVTPEEFLAAHRALRERTVNGEAEAMVFLVDYLRGMERGGRADGTEGQC